MLDHWTLIPPNWSGTILMILKIELVFLGSVPARYSLKFDMRSASASSYGFTPLVPKIRSAHWANVSLDTGRFTLKSTRSSFPRSLLGLLPLKVKELEASKVALLPLTVAARV